MPLGASPTKVKGTDETSYVSGATEFDDYWKGTLPAPKSVAKTPELEAPLPEKIGGEEQTSYVSPGSEKRDYYMGDGAKAPDPSQRTDSADFVNAAILLSDPLGSYEEATIALLAAKAGGSELDMGALRGLKGKAGKMAEGIRRNMALVREAVDQSLEGRLRRVAQAIRESRAVFGAEGVRAVPVATMRNHVLVVNTDGDLFRAAIEESDGCVRITKVEKFSGSAPAPGGVSRGVSAAADALLEGKSDKARVHLKDLLAQSAGEGADEFVKSRHQGVLKSIKAETFWREHVRTHGPKMRAYVKGGLDELYKSGVRPKFLRLRSGTLDGRLAEQYREPVRKALQDALGRLSRMREELSERQSKDQWLVNSLHAYDQRGFEMSHFLGRFVGDYLSSLATVEEGMRGVMAEDNLPFQAALHDTVAEAFPDFALAYLFVKKALGDIRSGAGV